MRGKHCKKGYAPGLTHNGVIGKSTIRRQEDRHLQDEGAGLVKTHADGKFFIRIRRGISVSGQIAAFPVEEKTKEKRTKAGAGKRGRRRTKAKCPY